ncbi:MAG: hypothetical protein JSU00_25320 [Acidobacteria bacterium]|nr:hypothetical protein [Acidobacteriota bacterium]
MKRRTWLGAAGLAGFVQPGGHAQAPAGPKALFRDPIYDGAADPTIVWNPIEKAWWIFYTNRRATAVGIGVSWCHGTDIGIASSDDNGRTWRYRGITEGLKFEHGTNTFWAPEILWHDRVCHMYFSYVRGVPNDWSGERHIVHATSRNLWDWKVDRVLQLSSDYVIDACVERMPAGQWRMWYKDERNHSHTYAADSRDLSNWEPVGPVITDVGHEGPNVFHWRGSWWMITDHWKGLGVYKSTDAEHWTRGPNILDDQPFGHHADVLAQGDRAFIFYFTHPESNGPRTYLYGAELELKDGWIVCDRHRPSLDLKPADTVKIVLTGDSTVNDEGGWGTGFAARFGPEVFVVNLAKNGRSSKSFRDEGLWMPIASSRADYVLIQFGHNDVPGKGADRETDPETTYRANLARYVDEVRAAGAVPVLVTSIVRRNLTADGKVKPDSLVPYVAAVRKLAAEKNVALIDLYQLTLEQCNSLGPAACGELGARLADGKIDNTHLGPKGKETIGAMAAKELVGLFPALTKLGRA